MGGRERLGNCLDIPILFGGPDCHPSHLLVDDITLKPSVSIIICTYNRVDLLKDALESALVQTIKAKEIIVLDDCSTDDTREFMLAFWPNHPEVRYFRWTTNRGQYYTKTMGLYLAKGSHIIFLDDDNFFTDPGFLEEAVKADLPIIIFPDYVTSDRDGFNVFEGARYPLLKWGDHHQLHCKWSGMWVEGQAYLDRFHEINHYSFCLFRLDLIDWSLYPPGILSWDMALTIPIAIQYGVGFWHKPVAVWFQHTGQMSKGSLRAFWKNRKWMQIVQAKAKQLGYRGHRKWRIEAEFRYAVGVIKCLLFKSQPSWS